MSEPDLQGAAPAGEPATPGWQSWWKGLAARERLLLAVGAAVLGLGLVWMLAVQPAWRTLARAPAELDRLDLQLQDMRKLAAEVQQLRGVAPVAPEQAAVALNAATARLGERAKLTLTGERAVLTLTGVGPGALRDWLAEARAGARARPIEANLSRGALGFSGTLVLALGSGG
jgi:general secretion pathway protein M